MPCCLRMRFCKRDVVAGKVHTWHFLAGSQCSCARLAWRAWVNRHREVVSWRETPFLRFPLLCAASHRRTWKRCHVSHLKAALASHTAVEAGQAGFIPGVFSPDLLKDLMAKGFPHVHQGLVFVLVNLAGQAKFASSLTMPKSSRCSSEDRGREVMCVTSITLSLWSCSHHQHISCAI